DQAPPDQSYIDVLPDVPHRTILKYIPLNELISHIPLVHSKWITLQRSVLAGRRCLVLMIGYKPHMEKIVHASLVIPYADQLVDPNGRQLYPDIKNEYTCLEMSSARSMEQPEVEQIAAMMPNISQLEIVICEVWTHIMPQVIYLLEQWRSTLKTLKLH